LAAGRRFYQAQEQAPKVAGWLINQIGQMYGWERQLRLSRAGPALRQAHRRAHSRMVVERFHRALDLLRPRYLPQSPMGQAITYALNQWRTLERFLDHGEVEIDNNLVRARAPAQHDQSGSRSTDAPELAEDPSTTSQTGRLR
jgi:transposase